MKERIANLLTIKSLVTLLVVITFLIMCLCERNIPEILKDITLMVVSFYFGTQHEKTSSNISKIENEEEVDINGGKHNSNNF